MGMMSRMRSLTPWFIITVGGLFVLFMVLSDSKVVDIIGQRANNVGSINGEDISYQEYSAMVEQARQMQVQQTGNEIDESQMDAFRDQVWDGLVSQKLIAGKINEFGIVVTDEEIKDILLGPNPPADLRQSFTDSTGNFNREAYETALFDPRNKEILLQVEDAVREQRIQQKLQNYLLASVTVSEDEMKRKYIDQTIKLDFEYAFVDVNSIRDNEVKVEEGELEKYYDSHIDDYKIDPQRKVEYVLFERRPSKDDSTGIFKNLSAIINNLQSDSSSFKTYVEIYSDQPYSVDTLSLSLIPDAARAQLDDAKSGDIVGPVLTPGGYVVYKMDKKIRGKETVVRASHILIKFGKDDAVSKAKADSLYNELKNGADFAQLAIQHSEDPGSAVKGGDLGWFGRGQMVKEFENAAFNGQIGVVQKPFKSNYGFHIVKVTGKSNTQYVVEQITNKIEPSPSTIDNLYNNAGDFAYLADKNSFDSEADLLGYSILETPAFTENAYAVPGLGYNKALVKFAFENGTGSISPVFKVNAGYVVARVSEIQDVTHKPIEEVKSQISAEVVNDKKVEMAMEFANQIKASVGADGDLETANTVYPKVKHRVITQLLPSAAIAGLGRQYGITNYALDAELNKVSDPIKIERGAVLIKVTGRTEFNNDDYLVQRNSIRDNLLQQKKSRFFTSWLAQIKDEAEIEDNRHLFYR